MLRQTASIKFTQRPKISILAPQGRLVAPIYIKFGKGEGHMVPLIHTKFHDNWCTEVGTQPQKVEKFQFLIKIPSLRGEPLDRFGKMLGAFMCPTTLHKCFKFDLIHSTVYGVIAGTLHVRHSPQILLCTL